MNAVEAIEIGREALVVTIKIGAPVMIVALIVGLSISLVQALTQIQEMTLSFVPKIIIIFISIILLLPFMLTVLTEFTQGLSDRIISLGT
ncbi:MAG: flagellar biosynthesis protein FliQ [Inquilinaceae bacterium]